MFLLDRLREKLVAEGLDEADIEERLRFLKDGAARHGFEKELTTPASPEVLDFFLDKARRWAADEPLETAKRRSILASRLLDRKFGKRTPPPGGFQALQVYQSVGTLLWPHSYKQKKGDREALQVLAEWTASGQAPERVSLGMHTIEGQALYMFSAKWVDQGLPVVRLHGHKYAAALLSTVTGKVDVPSPWAAFLIQIPVGLLTTRHEGRSQDIDWLAVTRHDTGTWTLLATTSGGVTLRKTNIPTDALSSEYQETDRYDDDDLSPFFLKVEDHDTKVLNLLGRLAINVSLAMTDPNNFSPLKRKEREAPTSERGGAPDFRTFVLGRPVSVDCRPALSEYLSGDRGKLSVQLLVAGHWKRQPYGPRNTLRRVQWIEPYWRGPEDAPILQRPHDLGK